MSDLQSRQTRVKLKLIGSISIGDKIGTRFLIIQQDTFFTKLSRWAYSENRLNTVSFVRNTVLQSLDLLRTCTDQSIKDSLQEDLKQALIGLTNISETYSNDVRVLAELSEIEETIKRMIPNTIIQP
jgi:hypothetical protein